jgi:hypothetical protein
MESGALILEAFQFEFVVAELEQHHDEAEHDQGTVVIPGKPSSGVRVRSRPPPAIPA